ncbi:hypothetical protein BC826DRAFT_967945 [Russula brevipes]|nr:hypothetical protein BC826DRAFT_967945 [Russula brevipes]
MRFALFALLLGAITAVNAHFNLSFPAPRGALNFSNEFWPFASSSFNIRTRQLYDRREYQEPVPSHRGFRHAKLTHAAWNLSILISTAQNPKSFADFNDSSGKPQFARRTANATGTGVFCVPLDLSSTGISGVGDGANVTIQIVYNDDLYQCSDLTLSRGFTIPSGVSCSNASSTSPTSASSRPTSTGNSGPSLEKFLADPEIQCAVLYIPMHFQVR